jgi:hypothetical protein
MRFDGPEFARGWLAVATAASSKERPAVDVQDRHRRGVPHAVRLYATDGFMLLVAGARARRGPPRPDARPGPRADRDRLRRRRARRQLLGHVLALGAADREGQRLQLRRHRGLDRLRRPGPGRLRRPTSADRGARAVVRGALRPRRRAVYLPVVDTAARTGGPRSTPSSGEETKQITLNPEFVERIGRVRRYAEGSLVWRSAARTGSPWSTGPAPTRTSRGS